MSTPRETAIDALFEAYVFIIPYLKTKGECDSVIEELNSIRARLSETITLVYTHRRGLAAAPKS